MLMTINKRKVAVIMLIVMVFSLAVPLVSAVPAFADGTGGQTNLSPAEEAQDLLRDAAKEAKKPLPTELFKIFVLVLQLIRWGSVLLFAVFGLKILGALFKGMFLDGREFNQVKKDLGKDFLLVGIGAFLGTILTVIIGFLV